MNAGLILLIVIAITLIINVIGFWDLEESSISSARATTTYIIGLLAFVLDPILLLIGLGWITWMLFRPRKNTIAPAMNANEITRDEALQAARAGPFIVGFFVAILVAGIACVVLASLADAGDFWVTILAVIATVIVYSVLIAGSISLGKRNRWAGVGRGMIVGTCFAALALIPCSGLFIGDASQHSHIMR